MHFFKPIKTASTLVATCGATLLVATVTTAPAQAASYTKVNSGTFNGHLYEVWKQDSGTLTWSTAQNVAATMLSGSLVSINSQAENNFVAGLIQDPSLYTAATSLPANNYVGPYIGLQRIGAVGTPPAVDPTIGWQWLDGTPLTAADPLWSNWNALAGQPDLMNGDNVALFYNGNNGSSNPPVGQAGYPTVWGDIYNGTTLVVGPGSGNPNPYLANSFVIERVPGPLPVMGAFVGFRLSRRLRRRTSEAARNI